MGRWLDLDLSFDKTIEHMEELGIRRGLAETILLIEQGKITGDVEEDSRPDGSQRLYLSGKENVEQEFVAGPAEEIPEQKDETTTDSPTQQTKAVSLNIDDEAGDWIKKVRDGGGGLMIGPDDGIIAVPEGPGEREPVEEEPVESEPETVDDIRKLGRDALASPAEEEEVEGAIKKTMLAIRRLLSGVERTLRRDHD